MKPALPALLALMLTAACGPGPRLVKEGRLAAAAEQWPAAYQAYDKALTYKPEHPEAMAGRAKAQGILLDRHGAALDAALREGRLDAVVPELRTARRFDPDVAWVRQWQIRWGDAWVDRLEARLSQANQAGERGDAWVYAATLREFDETDARLRAADAAWDRIREQEWPAVALSGAGTQAQQLVSAVAVGWRSGAWAEVPLVRSAPFGLEFTVEELGCRTVKIGTRTATQRYRDGTMVPNPRVPELKAQIRDSDAQLINARAVLQTRQRAEDEAFRRVERTRIELQRFLPSLDAAEQGVLQAAEQRDRTRAAVSEAEEAVQIVAELRRSLSQLTEEQRGLGRVRRDLESERSLQQDRMAQARAQHDETDRRMALARESAAQARERLEQAREKTRGIDASLAEIGETLGAMDVEVLPEGSRLPPMPKLKQAEDEAEAALEQATNSLAALQSARDAAAQAATTGDPAALAALTAAEAALTAQQGVVAEAAATQRTARIDVLQARVRQLRRRRQITATEAAEAEQAMVEARGAVAALEPLAESSQRRLDEAAQALQGTDHELAAVEDRLRTIDHRLPRLTGRLDNLVPIAADLVGRQSDFRRALDIWRAYEADLDDAVRTTAALTDQQDRAVAMHQASRTDRLEAASIVSGWEDRVSNLDQELKSQPAQVELVKTAPYTVTQHERTCRVQVAWHTHSPTAPAQRDRFVATRVDRDDTHRANTRIRLAEDALDLGQSDEQVVLALRAQAAGVLGERLVEQVQAEGRALREQAPAARDARTRALLMGDWMAGTTAIANHLTQAYDLPGEAP